MGLYQVRATAWLVPVQGPESEGSMKLNIGYLLMLGLSFVLVGGIVVFVAILKELITMLVKS